MVFSTQEGLKMDVWGILLINAFETEVNDFYLSYHLSYHLPVDFHEGYS
jgi:hypothetical protein